MHSSFLTSDGLGAIVFGALSVGFCAMALREKEIGEDGPGSCLILLLGFGCFIYTYTCIIHVVNDIHRGDSVWASSVENAKTDQTIGVLVFGVAVFVAVAALVAHAFRTRRQRVERAHGTGRKVEHCPLAVEESAATADSIVGDNDIENDSVSKHVESERDALRAPDELNA
eukprot:COSAG02_NODE_5249_length_4499_cov_25.018636_4_plen_171_part_00